MAASSPSKPVPHARGAIPNLRWRNPTWDDLRRGTCGTLAPLPFDPLPFRPRADPAFWPTSLAAHAAVRQTDRALTRALHSGVLTGGRLLAYLGFREPPAAARLGLPPPRAPGVAFTAAAADVAAPTWDPVAHGLVEADPFRDEAEARAGAAAPLGWGAACASSRAGATGDAAAAAAAAVAHAGPGAVAMAWGSAHEPAALAALAAAVGPAGSRLGEAGLCRATAAALTELGLDPARTPLPHLGASPDGILTHSLTQACVDGVLKRAGAGRGRAEEGSARGDSGEDAPPPLLLIRAPAEWREVVEVKSVSPFAASRRGPPGAPPYALADPGPRSSASKALARALPQLQLEMLCAGTTSGLLASSSATRGVRVWRCARDDAYLRLLLETVVSPAWVATRGQSAGGSAPSPPPSQGSSGKKKQRGGRRGGAGAHAFRHPAGEEAVQAAVTATLRLAARAVEVGVVPPAAGWGCTQAEAGRAFL